MPEATRLPVSESDRRELQSWQRAATTRRSHAERARIILLSAEGLSAEAISEQLGVVRLTVYKWRSRYRRDGVDGLKDLPRPGQPRKMTPEKATPHSTSRPATYSGGSRKSTAQGSFSISSSKSIAPTCTPSNCT